MIRKSAVSLLLACVALSVASSPAAETESGDALPALRLSVSDAVGHGSGSALIFLRYGDVWGLRMGFWVRQPSRMDGSPEVMVAFDRLWASGKWRYGLGLAWINDTNNINGTHWNFHSSIARDLSDRFFIELSHASHGSKFGIKEDAPNGGWTFLGIGVRL